MVRDTIVKDCPVRVKVRISNAGNVADANPAIEEPIDDVPAVASFSNLNVMDVVEDVVQDIVEDGLQDIVKDGVQDIVEDIVENVIEDTPTDSCSGLLISVSEDAANPEPERIIKHRRKRGGNTIGRQKSGNSKKVSTNPGLPTDTRSKMISPIKTKRKPAATSISTSKAKSKTQSKESITSKQAAYIVKLEAKVVLLEGSIKNLKADNKEAQKAIKSITESWEKKVATADLEAEKYLERNSSTIDKFTKAREKKNDRTKKKICSIRTAIEKAELEALVSYESSTRALEVKHEAQLQKKQAKHDDEMILFEDRIRKEREMHNDTMKSLEAGIQAEQEENEMKVELLENQHTAELKRISGSHA